MMSSWRLLDIEAMFLSEQQEQAYDVVPAYTAHYFALLLDQVQLISK